MFTLVYSLFYSIRQGLRNRAVLQAEILALRHQLLVLQRSNGNRRPRLSFADRLLWIWLSQLWSGWRSALMIVKPETLIVWHRRGLRVYWSWNSRHPPARPSVSAEVIVLIRKMSQANPRWGAPRIHGELLKLGCARRQRYRCCDRRRIREMVEWERLRVDRAATARRPFRRCPWRAHPGTKLLATENCRSGGDRPHRVAGAFRVPGSDAGTALVNAKNILTSSSSELRSRTEINGANCAQWPGGCFGIRTFGPVFRDHFFASR